MILKKRLPLILIMALCFASIGSVNFSSINADSLNAEAIIQDSCEMTTSTLQEDNAIELLYENDNDVIYTNNDQPIETDDLSDIVMQNIDESDNGLDDQVNTCVAKIGEDNSIGDITDIKMNLFAVASYQKNGITYVNYVYSDVDEMSEKEIKDELTYSIEETNELTDTNVSLFDSANAGTTGTGHYVHTKTQTLRGKSDWNALIVSTAVEMSRKSKKAVINGKSGSVWDIVAKSSFETSGKYRVGNTYTRLSISDFANQKLLDWGPTGTNSGTVSFALSGSGPSVSYSFSTGNKIKSLSSQSGKYGRWNMTSTSHRKTMSYKPGIRSTNTVGKIAIDVSHSANHYVPSYWGYQVGTGVWRIYAPDRS